MVDHQIDELDLIRSWRLAEKKAVKGPFCCLSVQPNKRAQEKAQSIALLFGAIQIFSGSSAGITEHLFQLLNVSSCQRFIEPELLDGCVIFVCSQKLAGLSTEFLEVRSNAETGQFYRGLIPDGVFEVGIYGNSLALFNQLD